MEIRECVAFGPTLSQHLIHIISNSNPCLPCTTLHMRHIRVMGGGLTENELDLGLLPSEGDANHDDLSCLSIGNVMQ